MTTKNAINGFGRTGRGLLRSLIEGEVSDIDVVAISDLGDPEMLAHLLKYDSVHGPLKRQVSIEGDNLCVDGKNIRLTSITKLTRWSRSILTIIRILPVLRHSKPKLLKAGLFGFLAGTTTSGDFPTG